MEQLKKFSPEQIKIVNNSVAMAEELVSNFYKMSANQWLHPKYDVKTLTDLKPGEIVHGPFAQVIRYKGQHKDSTLGSASYDFYKICLQDHFILAALEQSGGLKLFPFSLYIVTHELIHIVRFSKFLQNFDASSEEMLLEESRVHDNTHQILCNINVTDIKGVLKFYEKWRQPVDDLRDPQKD